MQHNPAIIFDACVLFSASIRDLIVELSKRAFIEQYFRAKWTEKIHQEWIQNLLKVRPDLSRKALERTRWLVDANVLDCLVNNYEHRVPFLKLKDLGDRHVLAAVIECGASAIVTFNLKDFPNHYLKRFSIVAMHPDKFICELMNHKHAAREEFVWNAVCAIKDRLKNPKLNWEQYFAKLKSNGLVRTVEQLERLKLKYLD